MYSGALFTLANMSGEALLWTRFDMNEMEITLLS